jgi:hypothetical protein
LSQDRRSFRFLQPLLGRTARPITATVFLTDWDAGAALRRATLEGGNAQDRVIYRLLAGDHAATSTAGADA